MRVDTFDYELAPDSIAAAPAAERDAARLMVLPPGAAGVDHRHVRDLPSILRPGSLVVFNDTRVIPSRLLGHKVPSGGKAEVLLLRRAGNLNDGSEAWEALGKASKGMPAGTRIRCGDVEVTVVERAADGTLRVGVRAEGSSVADALERWGRPPLPPYIKRPVEAWDRDRYQTVFAKVDGAVAAPTAGLHFTQPLLDRLREAGCSIATVTLHVGLGTFQPVVAEDLDDHPMHEEVYDLSPATEAAIAQARERGAPVVAIGTTVVRVLETAADASRSGYVVASRGSTRLLIQPGYAFRVVDTLLTNFHLPRSTLLALVCAFGGVRRVLDAYALAQRAGYRFFSYGDAMLLSRASSDDRAAP